VYDESHVQISLPNIRLILMTIAQLEGRGVIVTGASFGLGKAIARACLQHGAHVYICARDKGAIGAARMELAEEAGESRVFAMQTDVADAASVAALVEAASRDLPDLLGIVNNAGMLGPKGMLEDLEWNEWWRTIQINLLGTVLCCRAVLPALRRANYGKIVNLSGGGATAPMPRMSAYAASKAAIVRFTETLAAEYAEYNIDVNAIAPGALNTRMLAEVLAAGPEKVGAAYYNRSVRQRAEGGASLTRAADLCAFLLSKQSDGITGKLISAVWDPWDSLAQRREQLRETDVYTLRRITPKDRGLDWEER
jgi:NAD(P)-dependent dehydrogenase (short-subunit alcohol dehydrogenase family)